MFAKRADFLRIEKIGDSQHRHQFDDPQYGGQYSVLVYGGIGFLVLSAVVWPSAETPVVARDSLREVEDGILAPENR